MSWIQSLSYPFMQHALVAILFAGVAFPLIGVFIISLNLIPLRFAMMHIALLGGAVGLFLKIDPLFLGLLFCAMASITLGPVSERMKLGLGTISGYFMTLTLGILWGNILSLTFLDLMVVGVLSLTILGIIFFFFKEIQAILYDREIARAVGLPERVFFYLIIFMLGLTIAVSMRMIGALLIDAFVLLPAMAATLIARSLKQIFFLSSVFGLSSGIIGLYLSFHFDIPASSMIILVTSLIIAACMIFRRR
jgi:ABC-type Mn2+/Zn2+ transport system permease subunit